MSENSVQSFENNSLENKNENYLLRLYITGMTPNCRRAVKNIKVICEQYLTGRYQLEIIDLYQELEIAISDQIIAAPTLIKVFPEPKKRLIGDMSDTEKVLKALGISQ